MVTTSRANARVAFLVGVIWGGPHFPPFSLSPLILLRPPSPICEFSDPGAPPLPLTRSRGAAAALPLPRAAT